MDNLHGFPTQQTWSAAQLDQLRQILQTATPIPTDDIRGAMQITSQHSFPGHSQEIIGSTSGGIPNIRSQTSDSHGFSHVQFNTIASSSSVPSSSIRSVPDGMTAVQYPKPDVNSMVFDPATGYSFDQITGLYYNAKADLFINKHMDVLLRWNPDASTYVVVGRASDAAARAQDSFQSIGDRQNSTTNQTLPRLRFSVAPGLTTISPPIPSSSQPSARDVTPFPRERSLTFEEMSPDRDESYPTDRYSPREEQSPDRDNVFNLRDRRRSLSFDEMTPERDIDDLSPFPRDKSPSNERSSQRSNQSPRRDSVFTDMRHNWDRDYNRQRSRDSRGSRERRSPRRGYSRSPRRDTSISSRRNYSRNQYSRLSDKRLSPVRDSRTSPSSVRSRVRGRSPQYTRGRSPERRDTKKRLSTSKGTRRQFSPLPGDTRDGRFHRSPSPSNNFARRLKNDKTERGTYWC